MRTLPTFAAVLVVGLLILAGCRRSPSSVLVGRWTAERMLTNSAAGYSQELYAGFVADGMSSEFRPDGRCLYRISAHMDVMEHTWRVLSSNGNDVLEWDHGTRFPERFDLKIIDSDTVSFADVVWKRAKK